MAVRRRTGNIEGAFPLLLIGSVLLVYAGILAAQEIGSKSAHLPLWGLFGGVGAVIVGAGIYSTFLEPSGTERPGAPEDYVTVPRAEWEARQPGRRAPEMGAGREEPIWWEGPPGRPNVPASRTAPPVQRAALRGAHEAPTASFPDVAPSGLTRGPAPSPTHRYSLQELRKTLDELEALEVGSPGAPRRPSNRPWATDPLDCADCDRRFSEGSRPVRCAGCGRGLCSRCAASSRSEDGELRCNDCRAAAL